jgi:hypothetical protein
MKSSKSFKKLRYSSRLPLLARPIVMTTEISIHIIIYFIRFIYTILLFVSDIIITNRRDIYNKLLGKSNSIIGMDVSLYFESELTDNNTIQLDKNIINSIFSTMPEIKNYLNRMFNLGNSKLLITNRVYKLFFMGILSAIIFTTYTKLPWWVYLTFYPSAHTPIYNFYVKNNSNTIFVVLTYLYLLSYSYTDFNNKFLDSIRNKIKNPISIVINTINNNNIEFNYFIDLIYSISNSMPVYLNNLNINFKDILVRQFLFNILMIILNYTGMAGGATSKKTKTKTKTKTKHLVKKSPRLAKTKQKTQKTKTGKPEKMDLFLIDKKYSKFTKKDWKKEFIKRLGNNSTSLSPSEVNLFPIIKKIIVFMETHFVKLLFSSINEYFTHNNMDTNINKKLMAKIDKIRSSQKKKEQVIVNKFEKYLEKLK